ncbi:hypothetical protein EDC14_101843 [Hydrogenispora ethanolica]|uniref:CNNM transmembrane domain-containing protein n=1 Tax=Hydrogenispora ethanolica TaxID=1082276 RepID=A0A4R1RFK4_HYDET|nr:hypothetical protein [Hydrogenispora ethanolica]TCL64745.1 hypothetical protein EDC14_101843 [Hydrogenispora ethanolica]
MFKSTLQALNTALLTFVISLGVSFFFGPSLALWLALLFLALIILTGIFFDIIGTSVTAAKEAPFHAMAADKVKGSKQAIYLIRRADRVANFCNDVIGDIAGTISGVLVAGIVLTLIREHSFLKERFLSPFAVALVAAMTVGGKALAKSYAISRANDVVFLVGKILSFLKVADFNPKRTKKKAKPNSRKVKSSK